MTTETRTLHVAPDITVLEISGRLNIGNSLISIEAFISRIIDQGVRKLVVDLTNLTYIDSSGIGMLVTSSGRLEQSGGRMRVAGARGSVARALELVHLDRIAPLDEDVESACRRLTADSATA
jgi:anti-sigma B factor antagonist